MRLVVFFLSIILSGPSFGQKPAVITGLWQGILIPANGNLQESAPFFIDIRAEGDKYLGLTREEIYGTEDYAIGKFQGQGIKDGIKFKHILYLTKSGSRMSWCKLEVSMTYNWTTGYLKGEYTSPFCRQKMGEIILHRSKATFSEEDRKILTHVYRDAMITT